MLMMPSIPPLFGKVAIFLLLISCQGTVPNGSSGQPPLPSTTVPDVESEGMRVEHSLEKIQEIAAAKEIFAGHGSSFIYIDSSLEGGHLIIHETFSSRAKYKSITPIVDVKQDEIIINCSYVRSIEDMITVSVGTYCRGQTEASLESIEDAISDEHLLTYSSSLPWLNEVGGTDDCAYPLGMEYAGNYIFRCQAGDGDETTTGLSIKIFSHDYRIILLIDGFELAPNTAKTSHKTLTFWGLNKESHHQIIEKGLP